MTEGVSTYWYISFMHFVVIFNMRCLLRCLTCSCESCRMRLPGQLAEQKLLTLLLQMLGDLASMGKNFSLQLSL